MKKLHLLIVKSFLGPFVLTFFIVMFVLIMQFVWKYIDDMMGKGLKLSIIAELLLYTSVSLVPMALPLAILMAALMTFGNMGEYNELTAMKSSGISLTRIMSPMIYVVLLLSVAAFFFSNYVMPVSNLKMRTLLHDVRQQRPEVQIRAGEFYNGIDDYSIRIGKKSQSDNRLYDIKIYDHTRKRGNTHMTMADSGFMKITSDNKNLILTLYSGYNYIEEEEEQRGYLRTYPHRIDKFGEQRVVIELTGFNFERSDESLFKNSYQMMSINQLTTIMDSLNRDISTREVSFRQNLTEVNYFRIRDFYHRFYPEPDTLAKKSPGPRYINIDSVLNRMDFHQAGSVFEVASSQARSAKSFVESSAGNIEYRVKYLRRHEIEWHRKFTLSIGCLIFLFIGAPLGAIIRKGGLGMPTVISVLMFIFWYIISLTGEKMVRESILHSYFGMWLAAIALFVIGFFLTWKAANDSMLFNLDYYLGVARRYLGIDRVTMLGKNIHLAGKFDYTEIDRTEMIRRLDQLSSKAELCHVELKETLLPKNILPAWFNGSVPSSLESLIKEYELTFHYLMTSRWSRISYIRQKLADYPFLNISGNILLKPVNKFWRWALLPMIIAYWVSIKIYLNKAGKLISISRTITQGLNNHHLLAELEMKL